MPLFGPTFLRAFLLLLLMSGSASAIKPKKKIRPSGPTFGSRVPIPGALRGKIYTLSPGTRVLPDFSSMEPRAVVYTTSLNYQQQFWDEEWFGIEYEGEFFISKQDVYYFMLTSDDGAELYIDGKRLISNDGIHATSTSADKIRLESGNHKIRITYFQGPKPYIALVLFVRKNGEKWDIFDTGDFQPTASDEPQDAPPAMKRK